MALTITETGRFIEQHGFEWYADSGSIVIEVPWWNPGTGEQGIEKISCQTLSDVRQALGY